MSRFAPRRIALLIVLACVLSRAHGQDAVAEPADAWVEHLRGEMAELNLTGEQEQQLTTILTDANARAAALAREAESLPVPERAQRRAAFRRSVLPKVMALLTDAQKESLKQNRSKRASAVFIQAYRTALDALDLSDAQRPKVEACLRETQAKFEAAFLKLPVDGQPADVARSPVAAVVKEMRRRLDEILTPGQRLKVEETMGKDDLP